MRFLRFPSLDLALPLLLFFLCVTAPPTAAFSTTSPWFRHRTTTALAYSPPNAVRIYTGDDGHSHLERLHISMTPFTDKEGARGWASPYKDCRRMCFRTSPPGYALDWHCAPRRQYVLQLRGHTEVECSDGTRFTAGPGDVLLAEDLTGPGHKTRAVGDEVHVYAVIPLDESHVGQKTTTSILETMPSRVC